MTIKKFIIKKIIVGPMATNCYIFGCSLTKDAAIIDPGDDAAMIKEYIKAFKLKPKCIILTHGHIDHLGAIEDFDLPVYAGKGDKECFSNPAKNLSSLFGNNKAFRGPDKLLSEGEEVLIGKCKLKVIETPGHTPGGICLLGEGVLFSGDSLFADGIGRTDFRGGDHNLLVKMIKEKLFTLDENTEVYPGHGEETSIDIEKRSNIFLA